MRCFKRLLPIVLLPLLLCGCGVRLPAAAPAAGSVALPVLMYHSVCLNPRVQDSPYVLSPAAFREDMEALRGAGYTAVSAASLLAWAQNGEALPEKPILITLDDGFYNARTEVLPILEETGMRAVVSIVGAYTEAARNEPKNPAFSYLDWEDAAALQNSPRVELGCHTYGMHALSPRLGCAKQKRESAEAYRAALRDDLSRFAAACETHLGGTPVVFAYPFGAVCPEAAAPIADAGYRLTLTCEEKVNLLSPGDKTLVLGRFNRDSRLSTAQILQKIAA